MIVFHEGLPGSGKSYEACAYHILPALLAGRRVVTNIEGIQHAKFAELTGIPESWIREKLFCCYVQDVEEQKALILEHSQKDSLIIIDEIQNLFPADRTKLSEAWMKYISEHRHEGLDVVLMGQDRRDCHTMWRRRIQRVIMFLKLTAVGRENNYKWTALEATRPEKFKEISSGVRKYESKFFGLYQSHTDGTAHKSNYLDDRANVLKTPAVKYGLPGFALVLCFSVYYLTGFFNPESTKAEENKVLSTNQVVEGNKTTTVVVEKIQAPIEEIEPLPIDVFDEFAAKHRLRLSAFIEREGQPIFAYIDILDSSFHLKDRYEPYQLESLGWAVESKPYGLRLTKDDKEYVVRPWPIDKFGQVDNSTKRML